MYHISKGEPVSINAAPIEPPNSSSFEEPSLNVVVVDGLAFLSSLAGVVAAAGFLRVAPMDDGN